jgi:Zn-dependent metalloprotease
MPVAVRDEGSSTSEVLMKSMKFVSAVCAAVMTAALVSFGMQALGRAESQGAGQGIGQGLTVRQTSARTGLASFASADGDGLLLPVSANLPAESRALSFLGLHGHEFGLDRAGAELQRAPTVDLLGVEHVRFQQMHMGVPVRAGEFVVHLRGAHVVAANGNVLTELPRDVTPALSPQHAIERAQEVVRRYRSGQLATAQYRTPQLEIFNKGMFAEESVGTHLAWFVEAVGPDLREYIWVDARTGGVLLNFSQLTHAKNRSTYDSQSTNVRPGVLMRTEGQGNIGDTDVDTAHNYAGDTYDYFFNNYGRDSYNGAGASLISSVRFCPSPADCPYFNAFWDGSQMTYGAGFSQADDVVGHELTHGVVEFSAGLLYYYQSGALNESMADIFGESIDLTNTGGTDTAPVRWLLGEDVPVFGAIRNMMNPNAFNDPGKMSDPQFFCHDQGWTNGAADSGGVHINSGVSNHAFALAVDGGTYNGRTVSGIGLQKAGQIWYRALTVYLTSGSTFNDAYSAVRASCVDLLGVGGITAQDCTQVTLALEAVEMQRTWGCAAAVATPPACPSGAGPDTTLFSATFEVDDAAFTKTSTTATNWVRTFGFAKSGDFSEYGQNVAFTSDHRLAMTNPVMLPAGARLAFDHAFEFETFGSGNFDGGVLEYSTDGVNWIDAGSLIEAGRTYNGTVSNDDTNPLMNRQAFVRQSFGYTGTVLNLSSLAGQNVRFRWRVGTDSIIGSFGWIIDGVHIYTCPGTGTSDVIVNGGFSGIGGWTVFGLPTIPQGIIWDTAGNQLNYYRPQGSTQGVVLQNTGLQIQGGVSLEAVWTMGNSDGVPKRYSVLIGDNDFSDLHVCTFWLDPAQSAQTYRMRTHTTKPIGNLTIWFYAASVGGGAVGAYHLDNVSMSLKPSHSEFKTDCEDPLRPLAGGATSGNLVANGDFAVGLGPWVPFGNLSHNSAAGGIFEFFKLAGLPAGVIVQGTGQPMAADQRMVATFQLGNSSGIRQRVTVILHDNDFSDLSACTFWLPPGLPMQNYAMRAYAREAWTNATVAVYPSTIGSSPTHEWLRLDNVNLQRMTGSNWGTECFEPGAN